MFYIGMGSDLDHWKHCLINSIQLFCRNYCQYSNEVKIDGMLAITLDQKEVILVKVDESDRSNCEISSSSNQQTSEQSEQLESILRYLAPSCRLLKKAPVVSTLPPLPTLWRPVSDHPSTSLSSELSDRCRFLNSLGLVPTTSVAVGKSTPSTLCMCCNKSVTSKDEKLSNSEDYQSNLSCSATSPEPAKTGCRCNDQILTESGGLVKSCNKRTLGHTGIYLKTRMAETVKLRNKKSVGTYWNSVSSKAKVQKPLSSSQTINCSSGGNVRDVKGVSKLQFGNKLSNALSSTGLATRTKRNSELQKHSVENEPLTLRKTDAKYSMHKKENSSLAHSNVLVKPLLNDSLIQKSVKPVSKHCRIAVSGNSARNKQLAKKRVVKGKKMSSNSASLLANKVKKKIANQQVASKNKKTKLQALYGKKRKAQRNFCSIQSVMARRRRSMACGTCTGCAVTEDCRVCSYCLDKKQYGGPNRLRQKCRLRRCCLLKQKAEQAEQTANEVEWSVKFQRKQSG